MWRGICESKKILLQNRVRYRVGNCTHIHVWRDPWLPCNEKDFATTEIISGLEGMTVANLMKVGKREWDQNVLKNTFSDKDFALIRQIPLSIRMVEHVLTWPYDSKGSYTVKSGYRLINGEIISQSEAFWK